MSKFNEKPKYIVYKITNDFDNRFYIGIHKTNPDIDDGYRGSGSEIKKLINKYGKDHFKRETLFVFDTLEEASNKEREIVNKDLLKDNNCVNMTYGGANGWININRGIKEDILKYPVLRKTPL